MGDFNTYLNQLQKSLNSFNPAKRDDILAEIQSHIEDGLQDPGLGYSKEERVQKMKAELGSPLEMADGFHRSSWSNRWLDFLLALVPLLVIFLVRFLTIIALDFYNLASPVNALQIPLLGIMPLYFGMIFIAQRRQSLALNLWWLSLTVVHLSNAALVGFAVETPIWWMLAISVPLLISWGLFGYKLWQFRHSGLLLAFALLPIMLPLADRLWGILFRWTLTPEVYGEHLWNAMLVNNFFHLSLVAFLFLSPQRAMRWLGLVFSTIVYLILIIVIWQPLPWFNVATFYWPLMAFPIVLGLILEYRHTRQHHLVSG
jgi:hypothetical protein